MNTVTEHQVWVHDPQLSSHRDRSSESGKCTRQENVNLNESKEWKIIMKKICKK